MLRDQVYDTKFKLNVLLAKPAKTLQRLPLIGKYIQIQMLIYVIVGGVTTTLDLFLFWFFVDIVQWWYMLVAAVMSPITLALNYGLHRYLTFESQGKKREQLPRYFGLVVFNYFAGLGSLYVFVDIFGIPEVLSRFLVYFVIITWNFAALKFVVFRK